MCAALLGFGCICLWSEQSRKVELCIRPDPPASLQPNHVCVDMQCPLCSKPMGDYLLHDLTTPPPYVRVSSTSLASFLVAVLIIFPSFT